MRSHWSALLARKIDESSSGIRDQVLMGRPTNDISLYNYHIGYLQGLQEALRLAEEVDNEQLGHSNAAGRSST